MELSTYNKEKYQVTFCGMPYMYANFTCDLGSIQLILKTQYQKQIIVFYKPF